MTDNPSMNDADQNQEPANEAGNGGEQENEFEAITSQEEFDRRLASRLARERDKYKGFEDFKEKAQKWDEYEAGNRTPDEKALEDAKTTAVAETTQKFMQRLVNTEVRAVASTMGFNDPDDALRVIGDELPVKDDEPDTDAIKKLVEKLATDKPYLLAQQRRGAASRAKPKNGEPVGGDAKGKGNAASALRQLAASRKGS